MKYFTKKWYLNGCVDKPIIEDENYFDYDTGIHDLKIIITPLLFYGKSFYFCKTFYFFQ